MTTAAVVPAETIVYGGSNGWDNAILDGLRTSTGWQNREAITLLTKERNPFSKAGKHSDNIDILLLSEANGIANPKARYSLEGHAIQSAQTSARGKTAIWPLDGGLRLFPSGNAMFAAGKEWKDFSLSVYLCPKRLENGDTLFFWEGMDSNTGPQKVTASFRNRRLVWNFQGFFRRDSSRAINLSLSSPPLVPGEWRYHQIVFNAEETSSARSGASPGLLEYRLDGIPVDSVHASSNGRENRQVFLPRIGKLSNKPLQLAPDYIGWLDEFKLEAASAAPPYQFEKINNSNRGAGRMPPMDTGFANSRLLTVRARAHIPGASRIRYFVRLLNTDTESKDIGLPDPDNPQWIEISMQTQKTDQMGTGRWFVGHPDESIRSRYFSIGYILIPDIAAKESPVLSVLEIEYIPEHPPEPPRELAVISGRSEAPAITWSPRTEQGVAGWWVFWGPEPRDYFSGAVDDPRYGLAWVPRNTASQEPPRYEWPVTMAGTTVYTSVRAAWPEGGPDTSMPPKPRDYNGLSQASRELIIYP